MTDQLRAEIGCALIHLGNVCVDNDNSSIACVLAVAANALLDGTDTELLALISPHSSVPASLRKQIQAVLGETETFNN